MHAEAFTSIERLDSGAWGWHARVGLRGGSEAEIELVREEESRCYVARTLAGAGAPTEIWTTLEPRTEDRTVIRVEFCVRASSDALQAIGDAYVELYTRLWDQDEAMMREREAALAARESTSHERSQEPLSLGPLESLRPRLPLVIELGGERFRIVEVQGELLAHGLRCPHRLGPLDECEIVEGEIVCPWHGYAFDLLTGCSADGRGLRLDPAPRVDVEAGQVRVSVPAPSIEA